MSTIENSIFSDEMQQLLAWDQHPMAKQFRDLVVQALKMQNESAGKGKHISFQPELLLEVASEIDQLLTIIKGLADIILGQTKIMDAKEAQDPTTGPAKKEYLS